MRAEDLQGDFVPHLEVDEAEPTVYEGVEVPTELSPHEVEVDPDDNFLPEDVLEAEEIEAADVDDESSEPEEESPDEDTPDPNAPQQMSMC